MLQDRPELALKLARDLSMLSPPQAVSLANQEGLDNQLALFDKLIPNGPIAKASRRLFEDGHYRQSVVDGFICLDNLTLRKSKLSGSGVGLMRTAFSASKPVLRLNNLANQSERDEQQGYMDLFAGVMMAVRNPRAHDHEWHDDAETALQLLHLAHHLALKIKKSRVAK